MDTFFRRLIPLLVLALGCLSFAPRASALDYAGAMAQCQAYSMTAHYGAGVTGETCVSFPTQVRKAGCLSNGICRDGSSTYWASWVFTGGIPPTNPCSGMASASIYRPGKILEGSSTCVRGPPQSDGSGAMCGANLSPVSPPAWNPNQQRWETYISFNPTGSICGEGQGNNPGQVVGPSGTANTGAPPIPDPVPPTQPDPPKICGGVSCYDPASNTACAMVGGLQVCTSGASGTGTGGSGSGGSGTDGSCTHNGDATICSGSPSAPKPSPADVPDPPGQVAGTDTGLQANPTTGATYPTTTTTYGPPGATANNGHQAGDSTPTNPTGAVGDDGGDPAPSSTAPSKDNGTFSGGSSCDIPPACSGDAVACGAAKTQWATTCQVHKDLAGDGPPSEFDALKGKYTQADVWSDSNSSSGNAMIDDANAGNYDQGGFGYAQQCPLHDLTIPLWRGKTLVFPMSKGCVIGPWIHGVVIALALFLAGLITMGKRS